MDQSFLLFTVFSPIIGAIVALIASRSNQLQRWIGLVASIITLLFASLVLRANWVEGIQIYRMGGWSPPYGIIFVGDMLSSMFGFMAASVMVGGFLYAFSCNDYAVNRKTFIPLFLTMETGLLGAFYTGDIFTLFVFIELLVLSSVGLTAMSDNRLGVEAAMKYLFINGMGSMFLLMGIGALYTSYGTLNMADIAVSVQLEGRVLLATLAMIALTCSFMLKSAIFPFHFWQPDFHTTAPTPISAMLSSVIVKIGIYGLIRLVTLLFVEEASLIRVALGWLGVISIFLGSLSALRTYNGKRLLAFSTSAQIGYILLGIGWNTPTALVAAILFAFNHAFIKSAMLMLYGVIGSRNQSKTADFKHIVGMGHSLPAYVRWVYLLGGMALAGLPPMNGFIAKVFLAQSGIEVGSWWMVGLMIGGSLLTSLYVFNTWQLVFLQEPNEHTALPKDPVLFDSPLAPTLLISAALLMGIFANPFIHWAERVVEQISDPSHYIQAVPLAQERLLTIERLHSES